MTNSGPTSLSETLFSKHFSAFKEPRRIEKGNFQYPLEEILFLALACSVCGIFEWKLMVTFGNSKIEWLRKFYPYKNGIPSHDVLNRVFNRLVFKEFNECFISWVNSIADISEGRVIALDGKTIRGTASKYPNSKLHIVSAFCHKNGISLGQKIVDDKSNEITAIPELLDLIAIKGCIVTIDAMGCQKDIAKKIIDNDGDYILMVKNNQPHLKEQIEKLFSIKKPEFSDVEEDLGHGRIEKRTCDVITNLDFLYDCQDWTSLSSIIRITSERTIKKTDVSSTETRFYISSLSGDAKLINNSIRKHWSIENNLHWNLDVIFKEDKQLNYAGNAPQNMNLIKKIALSMVDIEKSTKKSKPQKMCEALLNDCYREELMGV
jgi:predicted transposase YbfD/YdcC